MSRPQQLGFDLPVVVEPIAAAPPDEGGAAGLSLGQRAHVRELLKLGCDVEFCGWDAKARPVIRRRDKNGWAEYAIKLTGAGRDAIPPVRPLTTGEQDEMHPTDLQLLERLRIH